MDFLTDIDEFQAALAKIDMTESSLPVWHGRLVENVDCYNKVKTLLEIDEFEKAHPMLYRLNFDELTEDEVAKVDKLYNLGVERGFINKKEEPAPEPKAPKGPTQEELLTEIRDLLKNK